MHTPHIGIAGIGVYEPGKEELNLPNAWLQEHGAIGKKFARHSGIEERGVSFLSEEEMAMRAIANLQRETALKTEDCVGLIFVSSSLVPDAEWRQQCIQTINETNDLEEMLSVLKQTMNGDGEEAAERLRTIDWSAVRLTDWEHYRRVAIEAGISTEKFTVMEKALRERLRILEDTATSVGRRVGTPDTSTHSVNWACSGYVRAFEIAATRLAEQIRSAREKFVLIVTAACPSRNLDFGDPITGGLLGDYATATAVTQEHHPTRPPHLKLRHVSTDLPEASSVSKDATFATDRLFNFERRKNVLFPAADGSESRDAERLCWTMDGMGVLYAVEPGFVGAMERAVGETRIKREEIDWILGHQPGRTMLQRAGAGLREHGYTGIFPIDLVKHTGNLVGSSIPHALRTFWHQAEGIIACPALGQYAPGSTKLSQGCLIFETNGVDT